MSCNRNRRPGAFKDPEVCLHVGLFPFSSPAVCFFCCRKRADDENLAGNTGGVPLRRPHCVSGCAGNFKSFPRHGGFACLCRKVENRKFRRRFWRKKKKNRFFFLPFCMMNCLLSTEEDWGERKRKKKFR